jgi:hypothetical protein
VELFGGRYVFMIGKMFLAVRHLQQASGKKFAVLDSRHDVAIAADRMTIE